MVDSWWNSKSEDRHLHLALSDGSGPTALRFQNYADPGSVSPPMIDTVSLTAVPEVS